MAYQRGIARNRGQFLLQTMQVFFVGLVIGMERRRRSRVLLTRNHSKLPFSNDLPLFKLA
jgi:hypothetical protein